MLPTVAVVSVMMASFLGSAAPSDPQPATIEAKVRASQPHPAGPLAAIAVENTESAESDECEGCPPGLVDAPAHHLPQLTPLRSILAHRVSWLASRDPSRSGAPRGPPARSVLRGTVA